MLYELMSAWFMSGHRPLKWECSRAFSEESRMVLRYPLNYHLGLQTEAMLSFICGERQAC